MADRKLRAVAPGEAAPAAAKPKSVTEAAKHGTTRELLCAMRDRIAVAVQDAATPPRDLASLTKRLAETVREIEAIDAREGEAAASVLVEDGRFEASAI